MPLAYEVNIPGFSSHLKYVIGSAHLYLGNHDKALSTLYAIADSLKIAGDELNYGNILGSIGDVYLKMKQYEQAYNLITESMALTRKFDPKINETSFQISLGTALVGMGETDKGVDYLEAGIELAEEKSDLGYLPDAYFELAKAYEQIGQFEKAYFSANRSKILGDSLRNLQIQGRIRELNHQYEYDKVEQKLKEAQLKTALQQSRFRLFLLLIGLSLIILVVIYILRTQGLKRKTTELAKRKIELEYNILRAQMNPHFIFNALNSIQGFFSNQQFLAGNEYLKTFSHLIRKVLNHTGQPLITLDKELETLESYLRLEQLRLKDQLSYSIQVDKGIDPSFFDIPPVIIQPFVENAIWHGIVPKKVKGKVEIRIRESEDQEFLICEIQDDGLGVELEKGLPIMNQHSKAINITKDRLAPHGRVEYQQLLDVNGRTTGTLVILKIPKIYD